MKRRLVTSLIYFDHCWLFWGVEDKLLAIFVYYHHIFNPLCFFPNILSSVLVYWVGGDIGQYGKSKINIYKYKVLLNLSVGYFKHLLLYEKNERQTFAFGYQKSISF